MSYIINKTPKALVASVLHLVSLPSVYTRLEQTLKDKNHTRDDIANVICIDPALCARVLRIINSSYYSLPNSVHNIATAVNLIGENDLRNMVLVTSVVNAVSSLADDGFDIRSFWQHSIRTGIAAKLLAKQQSDMDVELLFICGLLHDIGQLILYNKERELFFTVAELVKKEGKHRFQVEQELLGFDHAVVGALLMDSWGLPAKLNEIIKYHHRSDQASLYQIETKLVSLADQLVRPHEFSDPNIDTLPLSITNRLQELQLQKDHLPALMDEVIELSQAIEKIICEV